MITDLHGRGVLSFVTNCLIVFQKTCTALLCRQQRIQVPDSPSSQYLVMSLFEILTILVHVLWYLISLLKPFACQVF